MSNGFKPYPVRAVSVGGEIRRRMDLTADKILNHIDISRLFADHYRNRTEHPAVPGGFTGYGMFLDAVVKAAAHGIGGEPMKHLKETRIAELTATQDKAGAITVFAGAPGKWDNHDQAYLVQAFSLDHRIFGSRASLDAAVRLGDFLIGRKTGMNLGLETAFLMLYRETGEKRFLDYCRNEFKLEESIDFYDRTTPVNGTAHVYTWIARVLAQLQYARLTGSRNPELLAGARELYRRVFGPYSSISGSCSGGIYLGEVWDDSQTGLGQWGETCVSAYLLRCTAEMFRWEPESVYGDLYERILYNAFFGAQSADGLRQRYFIPFNEPGEWYEHETYCCPNNLRRMMFELPDAVYFEAGDGGTAINLYTDSVLTLPTRTIVQRTEYPASERVALTVEATKPFTLTYRVPGWSRNEKTAGWATKPIPAGKTEWTLEFPMRTRWIAGTRAQQGRAALMRGPVVYAVDSKANNLTGFEMDLLTIDGRKQPKVRGRIIRVPCIIANQRHREQDVIFSRFSDESRTRTYFPAASQIGIESDALFNHENPKN